MTHILITVIEKLYLLKVECVLKMFKFDMSEDLVI